MRSERIGRRAPAAEPTPNAHRHSNVANRANSKPSALADTARVSPDAMREFGRELKLWRENAGLLSQRQAAAALTEKAAREKVSQSFVAQMEAGKVTSLAPDLLRAIAQSYKQNYEFVVARYARVSDAKSALWGLDIRTISELAEWELHLEAKSLWVVTPRILDDQNVEIQDAIIELLNKGCSIQYFSSSRDAYEQLKGELETTFNARAATLGKAFGVVEKQLDHVHIPEADLAYMTSSMVIANPMDLITNPKAQGTQAFLVFGAELTPAFGLCVTDHVQLRKAIIRLARKLEADHADREKRGLSRQ